MKPANTSSRFNRRAVCYDAVPVPMTVSDDVIALCREQVEPQWKRRLRAMLLPAILLRSGAWELGEGFQWGAGMRIAGARIGRYAFVGPGTDIAGPVSIGDLSMLSASITLVSGDGHGHRNSTKPMRLAFATTPRPVTIIGADCWVGFGAILREGIRLARGTVVAAGAVVTMDTMPYEIVGGVPARTLRWRFRHGDIRAYDRLLYGEL